MDTVQTFLVAVSQYSRPALFAAACIVAVLCALNWATRTRRISPFSPLGRFARQQVDSWLRGVEGPVLNAGGSPTNVPWWGLLAFVVLGMLAQATLEYLLSIVSMTISGLASGPSGALRAVVRLLFAVLQIALLVRVLSSWFGRLARMPVFRWSYAVTEPLLAPLRAVVPTLGPIDITPLILYYLISFLEGFVLRVI